MFVNLLKIFVISIVLSLSWKAQAKLFTNAYVSFELPNNWECKLKGSEWVCGNQHKEKATQAIIVLTAKESGPADSLSAYKTHLGQSKYLVSGGPSPHKSKLLHIKERNISDHRWIDGMRLGSEIPDFYTRYLATTKGRLAIVLTFSAHKKYYTRYSHDFLRAIESIRVVAPSNLLSKTSLPNSQINPQQKWFPVNIPTQTKTIEALPAGTPPKDSSSNIILVITLLIGTAGVYLFLKRKKS